MNLPKDAITYTNDVVERCEGLIDTGIWSGLHIQTFRNWLINFSTVEEKYFAACILDKLIYRSNPQTISLINHLFQRVIPDLTRKYVPPVGTIEDPLSTLNDSNIKFPKVCFVVTIRRQDPPSKSAHLIARYIKREFNISQKLFIKPWQIITKINQGVKTFFFIDDFLGTGTQFSRCVNSVININEYKDVFFSYIPLVAHTKGIEKINQDYPHVLVSPVELLSNEHQIFDEKCNCFDDGENSLDSIKRFYLNLLKKKKINIHKDKVFGYGNLGLVYAFEHASPNNSIPLLWFENNNWNKLFKR